MITGRRGGFQTRPYTKGLSGYQVRRLYQRVGATLVAPKILDAVRMMMHARALNKIPATWARLVRSQAILA